MTPRFNRRSTLQSLEKDRKNIYRSNLINIYLVFSVICLLITIFYLLANLERADKIIFYCIPGFVLGISAAIIYVVGNQNQKSRKR